MIRKLQNDDLKTILTIWENENIHAHDFISESYWKSKRDIVKTQFPQSEIYVYIDANKCIAGFIGLADEYIAGLFIASTKQSNGIGKQLLDYVKTIKTRLTLEVYKKNQRAFLFYQREGFVIKEENLDDDTGEKEFVMAGEKLD